MENQPEPMQPQTSPQPKDQKIEQNAQSLPSVSEILKRAINIVQVNFWTFVGINAVPLAIFFVLWILMLFTSFFTSFLSVALLKSNFTVIQILQNLGQLVFGSLFALVFVVAIILLQLWSQAALACAIRDHEEKISISALRRLTKGVIKKFGLFLLLRFRQV